MSSGRSPLFLSIILVLAVVLVFAVLLWYFVILIKLIALSICVIIGLTLIVAAFLILLHLALIPYYMHKTEEEVDYGDYHIEDAKEPGKGDDEQI